MFAILIQDSWYESIINSVSKIVILKQKTYVMYYKIQVADVNFKVAE